MKIKVFKTTEQEVDIEFPVYVRYCQSLCKITSERSHTEIYFIDKGIVLWDGTPMSTCNALDKGDPITEQEFNEAYDNALKVLFQNRPYGKVNLAQSFEDFKKTLSATVPYGPEDYPTIDRYDPLDPAATRHATKEINQFIP